jgi:hypothetical protein
MMSSLSHLRGALLEATSGLLQGPTFDFRPLDREVAKLSDWLGERGAAKPAHDAIILALRAFYRDQELQSHRQARLVCFGCVDPVLPDRARMIEDGDRFPKLLGAIDIYLPNARAFRLCYRGLLYAYFSYDTETALCAGRVNWERLRTYLRDRAANTLAPGPLPVWVETLQANTQLLSDDPGEAYGRTLLTGQSEEFDRAREALDIHEDSWLIWRLVMGQVEAGSRDADSGFQQYLPKLLNLLSDHPLAANEGLAKLLIRYCACRPLTVHAGLRDFAVARWGNPWLSLNKAKWSLVSDEARAMVADWLKLILIQQFFSLLAAGGINDMRRLKFWERYHDSIDDMYFALGNTARCHPGADFQNIRKKMAGRLLNLYSAGPPANNAFIMCIGDYVVVEFGLSGNACFVFRRDGLPFRLDGDIAGNGNALKHQSCVERLRHVDGAFQSWEQTFQRTLASLIGVQPGPAALGNDIRTAISSKGVPRVIDAQPVALSARPQSPVGQAPSQRSLPGSNSTPTVSRATFSERELSRLCDTRRIQIEDFRERNGNLWVLTRDTDGHVSSQLRSWGFAFKSGRGWWRK